MDELILAKSKAGHDKNHIYLVMKRQDEIVYLVNGKTRTCDNPKKKKEKQSFSIFPLAESKRKRRCLYDK